MQSLAAPSLYILGSLFAFIFLPTAAFAQVNYVLIPGGYSPNRPNGYEWFALVLSNKDGKIYYCEATQFSDGPITINCSNPLPYTGRILSGPNVVTMPLRGLNKPEAPPIEDFWQLDQQSGQLQFCHIAGATPSCVNHQFP